MLKMHLFALACFACSALAGEPLKRVELLRADPSSPFDTGATFNYHTGTRAERDLTRADLPTSHPLYVEEFGMEDLVLGTFDVSGQGHFYYVVFSLGPSWDLNYCLYEKQRVERSIDGKTPFELKCDLEVYAPNLTVAGDGLLYASGHNNTLTDEKRAFRFANGKFIEIAQPLKYVNKATTSKRHQQVFADEALSTPSFHLENNEPVTLIAVKSAPSYQHRFLLVNQEGLTGWVLADINQEDTQFKGVFFAGD